jgi:hypothetical protein
VLLVVAVVLIVELVAVVVLVVVTLLVVLVALVVLVVSVVVAVVVVVVLLVVLEVLVVDIVVVLVVVVFVVVKGYLALRQMSLLPVLENPPKMTALLSLSATAMKLPRAAHSAATGSNMDHVEPASKLRHTSLHLPPVQESLKPPKTRTVSWMITAWWLMRADHSAAARSWVHALPLS